MMKNLPVNSSNSIDEPTYNEHIKVDVGSKPKNVANQSVNIQNTKRKHSSSVVAQSLDFEPRSIPEKGVLFEYGRKSIFSQKQNKY